MTQRNMLPVVMQVNDLLSHFTHNTGQQWNGAPQQYQMLSQLAGQKLGIPVPPALLQSL